MVLWGITHKILGMFFFIGFIFFAIIYFFFITSSKSTQKTQQAFSGVKYLPLGDSYTIGEGVLENERWPNILIDHALRDHIQIRIVENPSRTGYTTQNLIDEELPLVASTKPYVVTVMIGVNDWVQGVPAVTFQKNLTFILQSIQSSIKNKNILLVTIPDFSVTPVGKQYANGRDIAKGIAEFNVIIHHEAERRGLPLADIYPISQKMKTVDGLINPDGLHPSAKEYALWEEIIYAQFKTLISSKTP